MSWAGDAPISPEDVPMLNLDARYLFGAPGAGLAVEGDLRLQQAREVAAWPGYRFGRYDDQMPVQWGELPSATTDDSGHVAILPELPSVKATGVPLTARATVRVKEGSGRPVERSLTANILPSGPMIGIKPGFEDDVRENSEATFSLIALTPDLKARNMDVTWELNRVRTRYQWYRIDGSWNWDPVTTRERVSTGTAHLGESPAPVAAQVAPDMLEVSLDAESYTPGDTATLRFVPRTAGKALISVMSNRLIDMITVNAVAGENTVTLPVTEDWGAGAYATATLIQPLDGLEGHSPTRALGLSYAADDPGPHQLTARFDVAAEAAPRGPLEVVLNVDGIVEGDTAYATIAAVDVGILNLTSFQSPD
ncbi:MAG: alpha-2-macroglobulin family protein, partial [Maritimibacter sp.]